MAEEENDKEQTAAETAAEAPSAEEAPKEEKVDATKEETAKKVAELKAALDEAKASGDKEAIKAAKKAYKKGNPAHKKHVIITWVIIVIAVIALAAAFLVWHEQPSFCNAICHTPMDYYVEESYYSGDTTQGVTGHAAAGVTCLDCHVPTLSEQIGEGISWIGGNYEFDSSTGKLSLRYTTSTLSKTGTASDFCLKSGCHTTNELEAATGSWDRDPHSTTAHGGQYIKDCSNCHREHGQSVLICASCHSDIAAQTPDGWATSDSDTRAKFTK